ncbi:hypothetical protein HDU83_005231 [Entophlyctis luteolus]|nr:hypothetical protein HDU83_005231 [Entophlyctis luteolus]
MLLGALLSSAVLIVSVVYRTSLLVSLYERVTAAKTAFIFVWSVSVSLRLILDVVNPAAVTVTYQRVDAAVSFVSYLWLVVLNVLVALSRFLEFDDRKNSPARMVFYALVAIALLLSGVLIQFSAVAIVIPNSFGIVYSSSVAAKRALIPTAAMFLASIVVIAIIYFLTYRKIALNVSVLYSSNLEMPLRIALRQKAFKTCFIFGVSSVLTYLPMTIGLITVQFLPNGFVTVPMYVWEILGELAMLMCVISPVLLVAYTPRVRWCLLNIIGMSKDFMPLDELDENVDFSYSKSGVP